MTEVATSTTGRKSSIQEAVQIVQDMTCAGMVPGSYPTAIERLHVLMADWSMGECRACGMNPQLSVVDVTADGMEDSPEAEAYWRQTSAFFRKVFQAAAAAA